MTSRLPMTSLAVACFMVLLHVAGTGTRFGSNECDTLCAILNESTCKYDNGLIDQAALKGYKKEKIIKGVLPREYSGCLNHTQLSLSNDGRLLCRASMKLDTKENNLKFIFIPCMFTKNEQPKMLHLHSHATTVFPAFEGIITSAAYISTREMILLATSLTKLFWLSLDGQVIDIFPIQKELGASCMAFDDQKKLIVLVAGNIGNRGRMLTDKGGIMFFRHFRGCTPRDMVLQSKHSDIFILCPDMDLVKYDYRFRLQLRLRLSGTIRHMFFDEFNDYLYLLKKKESVDSIHRLRLSPFKSQNIGNFRMQITSFIISGNLMYAYVGNLGHIAVLNIAHAEEPKLVKTIGVKFSNCVSDVIMIGIK